MEELDEFGIPIRKPTQEVDEFGIPIKKKVDTTSDSTGGAKISSTGSPIFPSVDTKTPTVLTPKGKAEYQEQVASFKPPVLPKEGEPKKPKPDGGAGTAFMAGLNTFNKGLFKTPRLLYDAASSVTDAALQALNLQQDETNYDDIVAASGYSSPLSVLDRLGDYYEGKAGQYAKRQEKFDKGIIDSFTAGEFKAGGKQLLNNISESIPSMVGMALTGGAGNIAKLGYAQKTIANALPFISQKNAELDQDESIPKPVRVVNATLNGLSEVIFDQSFGTQAMVQNVVDVFQKQGRDAAVKVGKNFIIGYADNAIKKIQPVTGAVKGAIEEMATQLSQNIVDRYTVDPEKDLTEGVLDAGLTGGVMTGGIGAIGSVAYSSSQKKKVSDLMKQREELVGDLDNENLPEEVKSDLSDKLSKVDNQISKIDDDNETVVAKLSAEDKTILQEKEAKINAIEESLQDGTLSETAKNTLADTLLKEQEAVDTILTKEPEKTTIGTEEQIIAEGQEAETKFAVDGDQVTYEQKLKELDSRANKLKESEKSITIGDAINDNGIFYMNGELGNVTTDGQSVVFETKDKIYEIGNVDELSNKLLNDIGIEKELKMDVSIDDNYNVNIDGVDYINNFSNKNSPQNSAINYDENGHVKSVTLETENGQKRTFRGQKAEEIAYQYKLKEFEDNATEQQIEQAISEADRAFGAEREVAFASDKKKVRIIKKGKVKENAVQEQITDEVSVQPEAAPGREVAEGVPAAGLEVVTGQSETLPQGEGEVDLERTAKKDYEMTASEYEAERQLAIPVFNKARQISNRILSWSGTDGLYEKYLKSIGVKDKNGVYEDTSINDIDGYMKFLLKEKANFFTEKDYDTYLKYKDFMDRGIDPDWQNHQTRISVALSKGENVPNEVLSEYPQLVQESPLSAAFDLIEQAKRTKKTEKGKMEAGELAIANLGDVGKKAIFIDNNFKDIVSRIRTLKDQKGEPFVKIDCS